MKSINKPTEEVKLQALRTDEYSKELPVLPTQELLYVPINLTKSEIHDWLSSQLRNSRVADSNSYLVVCHDTEDVWLAYCKRVLDTNFIYRRDLKICEFNVSSVANAVAVYMQSIKKFTPQLRRSKSCYILDDPCNETYEVYYDSNYPLLRYGKSTPDMMYVYKYTDRFKRDTAILLLDRLYSSSSAAAARNMTRKSLHNNEAIVITDGSWSGGNCAGAFFYLDSNTVTKMSTGFVPSDDKQASLLAEITAAKSALMFCKMNGKNKITLYCDSVSVINATRKCKAENLPEVVEYRKVLSDMSKEGYSVTFAEVHPKITEERLSENKALMFFHNSCDRECRAMTDIFSKRYKEKVVEYTSGREEYIKHRR